MSKVRSNRLGGCSSHWSASGEPIAPFAKTLTVPNSGVSVSGGRHLLKVRNARVLCTKEIPVHPMPRKQLPQFVAPMIASSIKEPFDSRDWIFETKLDGFRAIAVIDSAGKARLWSRNRLPLEPKFPMVLDSVDQLKLRSRQRILAVVVT
jgi:ATP-dependent DNA ligase